MHFDIFTLGVITNVIDGRTDRTAVSNSARSTGVCYDAKWRCYWTSTFASKPFGGWGFASDPTDGSLLRSSLSPCRTAGGIGLETTRAAIRDGRKNSNEALTGGGVDGNGGW